MDACLDTLSTELYKVIIRVGHTTRLQVIMGGFALKASPPPPPTASEAKDDNDDSGDDDDSDNGDASSSSTDEMST